MRVSLSWLKDYVALEMDIDRLVDSLTMIGLEVDTVADRYAYLDSVLVGRINKVSPHPNAAALKICNVDLGDRSIDVVCGAPNARDNLLSAVALPGTVLPDGTVLQRSVIRGSASEGMLCSAIELGLGLEAGGIMELDARLPLGQPLQQALDLSDKVLEIDLTPNRPDCLSLIGIAREVAGIQKTALKYPDSHMTDGRHEINHLASVTIEAPDLCPRYAARLLTGVAVGPSPFWLQDRLLSVGLRPINNIVDVTNFVLMELGQPLHAFDFDQLAGHRIVVRKAAEGEAFTTLDQKERRLSADTLMICDAEKAVAIGGVMGGLNSEIAPTTGRVLIESAYFSPQSIRKTAKNLGLVTEASYRFERGVDPQGTITALNRAAKLMIDISGATAVAGLIDAHPKPVTIPQIRLGVNQTNRLLGTDFSSAEITDLLQSIGFATENHDSNFLKVVPPSFRVDVTRPEDLMEEVARLSGYNNIPLTYPAVPVKGRPLLKPLALRNHLKRLMSGWGFHEIVTYSFIGVNACDRLGLAEEDVRRRTVRILNPLSEEQTVMRTSLIPGLLETMQRNTAQQERNLKLFEIGKTFFDNGPDQLPDEVEMLTGLWTGSRAAAAWHSKDVSCDFFDLKGAVEALLERLRVADVVFGSLPDADCIYTKPGASARISVAGLEIGLMGEVHPKVRHNFELKQSAFIFELNIDSLRPLIPDSASYRPIPRYPAVTRDVTLIVDRRQEAGRILDRVEQMDEDWIESLQLFDVFEGDPIPAGRKSVSFRIVYRSSERTLSDEEVNRLHQKLTGRLLGEFKASLPA